MNVSYVVRRATRADAKRVAELAETTFRATFAATTTVEDMDLHCEASYSETIQASEISSANTVTLLGEHQGDLVGFAQLRWDEPFDCIPAESPGEIHRLYVRSDWHGK